MMTMGFQPLMACLFHSTHDCQSFIVGHGDGIA